MYDHRPLTGCYRGLALGSTVTCSISHYPYRDGKRKVILTVGFDRLRPIGVPLPRPVGRQKNSPSRQDSPSRQENSPSGLVPRPVCLLVSRLVGLLVSRVDGESDGGRSECGDETMPVVSSRGLSVSSSRGGPVRWCSLLPCP